MKRKMSEIRTRLHEIADKYNDSELHELAEETRNRSPIRRAPVESSPVTPDLERRVRMTALALPDMSYPKLGQLFNINQGRVSEILAGKL